MNSTTLLILLAPIIFAGSMVMYLGYRRVAAVRLVLPPPVYKKFVDFIVGHTVLAYLGLFWFLSADSWMSKIIVEELMPQSVKFVNLVCLVFLWARCTSVNGSLKYSEVTSPMTIGAVFE